MFNNRNLVLALVTSFVLFGCANQNAQMKRSSYYESNKNLDVNKVSP